jgi:N-acetylglucosamine transport system permease protein
MTATAVGTTRRSRHTGQRISLAVKRAATYALPVVWAIFTFFCITWVVLCSFKTNREMFTSVWSPPAAFQYQNYVKAWSISKLGPQFVNSLIVVSISVALLTVVSAPAAYILSRKKFKGVNLLTSIFIAGAGIPLPLLFIPLFQLVTKLQINNTLPGLTLIYVTVSIPFTMYLLTGFFGALPTELEEAGRLDGCSEFGVFRYVMLPLASPGLITASIFNFIALWNEYMLAMVFINDVNKMPISRGLTGIAESMQYTGDWVGLFAGVVIVMVPTIVMYVLLSRQLIEGITMGSRK